MFLEDFTDNLRQILKFSTNWVVDKLDFDQESLIGVPITITFANGQISGSTGCNDYQAPISSSQAQNLTIDTIRATNKACPESTMIQQTLYFAALQRVTAWRYVNRHQVGLNYRPEDGSYATIFLDPVKEN